MSFNRSNSQIRHTHMMLPYVASRAFRELDREESAIYQEQLHTHGALFAVYGVRKEDRSYMRFGGSISEKRCTVVLRIVETYLRITCLPLHEVSGLQLRI